MRYKKRRSPANREYLSVAETAGLLDVSPSAVYGWCSRKQIPYALDAQTSQMIIKRSDAEKFGEMWLHDSEGD